MSKWEHRAVENQGTRGAASAGNWSFWLTMIVTTLLVVLTSYVLRGAFFEPTVSAPGRHAAAIERSGSIDLGLWRETSDGLGLLSL